MQFVSPLSKDYQIIAVISQTLQHLKEIMLGWKLHLFRKRTLKTKIITPQFNLPNVFCSPTYTIHSCSLLVVFTDSNTSNIRKVKH